MSAASSQRCDDRFFLITGCMGMQRVDLNKTWGWQAISQCPCDETECEWHLNPTLPYPTLC